MNLFELFCKIAVDDADYQKGLDDAKKHTKSFAKNAGEAIGGFAKKAEKAFATAAKIASAAIGVASTGIIALTKASIAEYSNYEQLVGGVDTLFKESSQKVQEYAANAYQTAGMSANEYMDTVTSFSASLLQSLGGDTEVAAEKANTAITDMSDNANKMGTDMTAIQNAYQGFAKQNYTMLDNLKLGYGGTKEEMQRLIDDANALNAAQGKLTNYSIDSYADIVDAIHDVQTEMGITGTTAAEASTTIQGSVSSAKAAWHNLMIGIADDNQDFDGLVNDFVSSVETAADNILPRIDQSLEGILKLVQAASEKIIPRVITTISEKAPDLIDAAADIVLALGDGIIDNLDSIFAAVEKVATRLIPKISKAFAELVPKIAKSAVGIIKQIDGTAIAVGGLIGTFKSLVSGNWIGVGIGLATSAFGLAQKALQRYADSVYNLTQQEKDWIEAGESARDELQRAKDARNDNIVSIENETEKTQDLWKELQTLADKNGEVLDKNKDRAAYLLGELNDALGTEYTMNGNIIGQYQEMQKEIDKLIKKKQTEALLDAGKGEYTTALQDKDALLSAVSAAKTKLENAQAAYEEAAADFKSHNFFSTTPDAIISDLKLAKATGLLDEAKAGYDEAASAASSALTTINNYEEGLSAAQKGRYDDAISLLTKDTTYRWKHVDDIKKISEAEKKQMKSDLDTQRRNVEIFREQYKKGTEGFTKPMLDEMEASLAELEKLYAKATGDASRGGYQTGTALGSGINQGLGSLVDRIASTARDILDRVTDIFNNNDIVHKPNQPPNNLEKGFSVATRYAGIPSQAQTVAPVNINITVHADTDDLGTKIAQEVQTVVFGEIQSAGVGHMGGRTSYAY